MITIISCTGTWFSLTSGGFCSPPFADPLQIICSVFFAKMKIKIKKKVKALHYPHIAWARPAKIFYWEETIELHVHHRVIVIGIRNASNDDLPLECRQCGATGRYYSPDVAPCTYLYEARTKYIVRCTRELFQVGFWLNDNISHWRGCVPPSQG